jgi:hypothetical protein
MKKLIALSFSLGFIIIILSAGFSSRASSRDFLGVSFDENSYSMAASSLMALRDLAPETTSNSEVLPKNQRVKAVEVLEGSSVFFEGLGITVNSISEIPNCYTNCFELQMSVSIEGGEIDVISQKEGEVLLYGGYSIKISQVAPHIPRAGVQRRVVFILSAE